MMQRQHKSHPGAASHIPTDKDKTTDRVLAEKVVDLANPWGFATHRRPLRYHEWILLAAAVSVTFGSLHYHL